MSGQVIGLLVLISLCCCSCLHAGIYRDFPSAGLLITFHYSSYFYIKNIDDKTRDDANEKDDDERNKNVKTGDDTCLEKF